MCVICQKQSDFSLEHVEAEIKKLRQEQLLEKAKAVKNSITMQEAWLIGDRCDGFETEAVNKTIEYLKNIQYLLGRRM